MLQLFRDQCRDIAREHGRGAVAGIWRRMLHDLVLSLLREHTANLIETMNTIKAQRLSLPLLVVATIIGFLANPAVVGSTFAAVCVYLSTFALLARSFVEIYRPRSEWWKGILWGLVVFTIFGLLMPFWAKMQLLHGTPLPMFLPFHAAAAFLNLAIPLLKAVLLLTGFGHNKPLH
ncbi:MAG TPA: hypothetical protein VD994_14110 [Prosthecobacter sp.]|nr:hypothetical protein [Prosthecobacter sp.]